MDISWILPATLATLFWGGGYSALRKFSSSLSPYVIQVVNGSYLLVCNLIALAIVTKTTEGFAASFLNMTLALFGYLSIYCVSGVIGSFFYLYAANLPNVPISLLTAYTSCYPLVTIVINFCVWREYEQMDMRLAGPGIGCVVIGIVLLSLAKKVS